MKFKQPEKTLINNVRPKIFDQYDIHEEVGFLSRSIDMVLIDKETREITTIEFKISNWRKAIKQIQTHLLCADFSYLCMPKRRVSEELLGLLIKNGIGLWLYDFKTDELIAILKPQKSDKGWIHEHYNGEIKARLLKRANKTWGVSNKPEKV